MKERFKKIVEENITREGIDILMAYLEGTDFYTAPCSSKYHLCREGGLLEHSLNVYDTLKKLNTDYNLGFDEESMAICGLFHDICKTNFYVYDSWHEKYNIINTFPVGHGEKSVIILQDFIRLNNDEICAIRWHMGQYDNAAKGGDFDIGQAEKMYKLVGALHLADMISTKLLED